MVTPLEALDAAVETGTREALGDTIAYTPSGGAALSLVALVDYAQNLEQLSGSRVTTDDLALEVAKADVAEPAGGDRIVLGKRPGETFKPRDWRSDEAGDCWLIVLAQVPA